MNAMSANKFPFFFACSLFCVALFDFEAGAAEPVQWSYHEKNYEIYAPQFSADNRHLVFVRKRHVPDGHEAELFSEGELRQFDKQREINDRFEDPEIMLMNLADKSVRHIDYGWDPVFSRDQAKILYARQTTPISGYRVLAATLAGNVICEYDMTRHKSVVIAQPASGYLSAPRSTENNMIIFALSDAVNGAWGGVVGAGAFDPATGKQTVLYTPVKEYNLHHLVQKFEVRDGRCLVLRLRPLTPGLYMAKSYACELVDAASGTVLYSWGERGLSGQMSADADLRMCQAGPQIYDGGWRDLTQDKPASGSRAGFSSPDCAHVAVLDKERKVSVFSSRGETERNWSAPGGIIQSLAWSPDSSRIVLVISHGMDLGEKFEFDEMVILQPGAEGKGMLSP
jgi:hypothetical protein